MNIDQIMELADDYAASRELRCGIHEHRDRLRAAIVEALDMGEPVAWQYRWLNPGNQQDQSPEWMPVEPRFDQTLQEKITELEAYRYSGKPCYEVRTLYASKAKP